MKDWKKSFALLSGLNAGLNRTIVRSIQADQKELADAFERNKQHAEEIRRSANERFKRLADAVREPKKRFRP